MEVTKVAFIGHVDSGKSSLTGQMLYYAGYISKRELDIIFVKAKEDGAERCKWARVVDVYEEEQVKGKTHESVKIILEGKYEITDTPGHAGFIRSMIEGIYGVNIAGYVISMIDNEFEASFKGILKEHLIIARVSGIKKIILIANKMDAIGWDQKIFLEKTNIVKDYLHKVGYTSDDIISVPIEAYSGINLFTSKDVPEWYSGGTFVEALDKIKGDKIYPRPASETSSGTSSFNLTGTSFIVETRILNYDKVITLGFNGVIHNSGHEYLASIVGIKSSSGNKFIKNGDRCFTIWTFDKEITITDPAVLIRKDESTIGLSKVVKSITV